MGDSQAEDASQNWQPRPRTCVPDSEVFRVAAEAAGHLQAPGSETVGCGNTSRRRRVELSLLHVVPMLVTNGRG